MLINKVKFSTTDLISTNCYSIGYFFVYSYGLLTVKASRQHIQQLILKTYFKLWANHILSFDWIALTHIAIFPVKHIKNKIK